MQRFLESLDQLQRKLLRSLAWLRMAQQEGEIRAAGARQRLDRLAARGTFKHQAQRSRGL